MRPLSRLPVRRSAVRYGRPAELPLRVVPAPQADVHDGLRGIWRHRGAVALCTACFCAASVVVALWLPTYYVASARVQVGVPDVQVFASDRPAESGATNNEKVENERIAIQSRPLIKQVVDRLQLAKNPEFNPALNKNPDRFGYPAARRFVLSLVSRFVPGIAPGPETPSATDTRAVDDQLIDAVLARIDVSTLGRSQVLNIQASSRDRNLAAAIANTLAEVYRAYEKSDKTADSNRIEGYLARRIAELRQQVNSSERAVAEYRKKYGLYQGASASVMSQQLTELNTQLIEAQTNKAEADSRLREALALRSQATSDDALPEVLSSPVIQQLREQQAEVERNLAELSASLGPRHPKIINLRAAKADIAAKISAEVARVVAGLRHQARTAEARYQALAGNFERLKTEAGGVNEQSIELAALERDAAVNSNLLEAMLNRAKETFGREEIEQPDAKILSPASPPDHPSYPPKTLIVLLGTLLGALLGALLAHLREGLDRTFRRAAEVERATGLPVISMVPNLKRSVRPALQMVRQPISTYSEALRKIYVGLQLSAKSETPKTILFTSSTPAEGKSVMAASLGRLLALSGKRVLLIDCDWRSPTLHRIFQCSNRYGLAQLVFDDDVTPQKAIHNDPVSGADVLVSGGWTPHASEMLMSDRIEAMFATFAERYDLVILDSAPVLVSSEVLVLSRLADKTVFIVRWGHAKRDSVLDALRQLNDAQADISGIVMSRVDAKRYRAFAYDHLNYDYGSISIASKA
jgi:polysaccharide biosynthesis transport protein